MSKRKTALPTVDEVIALLKRSRLPTVIIEGCDDIIVYRRLEDHLDRFGVSVLAVGGRVNVLQIFDRLREIPSNKHIAFIVDQDYWVLAGVPMQYKSHRLFLTDGYSIENDLYRDGKIENVLDKTESENFLSEITRFVTWFSLAICRVISGKGEVLDTSAWKILDDRITFEQLITLKPGERYPEEIFNVIISDYAKFVRGKSLIQVISRQTSRKGRLVQLNHETFVEIHSANRGPILSRLFEGIEKFMINQAGLTGGL